MNIYNVRRATRALAKYISAPPGRRGAGRGHRLRFAPHSADAFARQAALVLCAAGVKRLSVRVAAPGAGAFVHGAPSGLHRGHRHHRQPQPAAVQRLQGLLEDGGQMPPESARGIIRTLIEQTTYARIRADGRGRGAWKRPADLHRQGRGRPLHRRGEEAVASTPSWRARWASQLKIVYTPLHGSGNIPVRRILSRNRLYRSVLRRARAGKARRRPSPPCSVPNPEDPAAFALALELQKELGADLCVRHRPGLRPRGHRRAWTAKAGPRLLSGNQIGCVLLHYILYPAEANGHAAAPTPRRSQSIVSTDMARAICDVLRLRR